jgi:hypothetical protein
MLQGIPATVCLSLRGFGLGGLFGVFPICDQLADGNRLSVSIVCRRGCSLVRFIEREGAGVFDMGPVLDRLVFLLAVHILCSQFGRVLKHKKGISRIAINCGNLPEIQFDSADSVLTEGRVVQHRTDRVTEPTRSLAHTSTVNIRRPMRIFRAEIWPEILIPPKETFLNEVCVRLV